ncbi:MAG: SOS response-associated peptidase [Candidatus Shapirobacteria bacterium]|jgi:putative SOS response-associated peptidase YedK
MCGRFALEPGDDFYDRFDITNQLSKLPQKIDAVPGKDIPVILKEKTNIVRLMRWGLVPFWAKDEKIGFKMFNARAETILEKPSFQKAFKTQRCLVPASGFYEWKVDGDKKTPYFFEIGSRPLISLAGLFDIWIEPFHQKQIYSFTIITTQPNSVVKPIHDRMPVILKEKEEKMWLDESKSPEELLSLLIPSTESLDSRLHNFA